MNQRALAVAGALLFSAGLAAPLPGVGVPAAGAGNPHGKFHVEWASSVRLDGQNRIHGYVRNDSGGTVQCRPGCLAALREGPDRGPAHQPRHGLRRDDPPRR